MGISGPLRTTRPGRCRPRARRTGRRVAATRDSTVMASMWAPTVLRKPPIGIFGLVRVDRYWAARDETFGAAQLGRWTGGGSVSPDPPRFDMETIILLVVG